MSFIRFMKWLIPIGVYANYLMICSRLYTTSTYFDDRPRKKLRKDEVKQAKGLCRELVVRCNV